MTDAEKQQIVERRAQLANPTRCETPSGPVYRVVGTPDPYFKRGSLDEYKSDAMHYFVEDAFGKNFEKLPYWVSVRFARGCSVPAGECKRDEWGNVVFASTYERSPCWLTAMTYEAVRFNDKIFFVYRLTALYSGIALHDWRAIHHVCRDARCVNPRHLQSLTRKQHKFLHSSGTDWIRNYHRSLSLAKGADR